MCYLYIYAMAMQFYMLHIIYVLLSLLYVTAENDGERIVKIGQYLAKLWTTVECRCFFDSQLYTFYV